MADLRDVLRYTVWSPNSGTVQSRVWTGVVASLPTASAEYRFMEATVAGDGSSTGDEHYRCVLLPGGTYMWIPIGAGRILRDTNANRPAVADWHGKLFLENRQGSVLGDRLFLCGQLASASWDFMRLHDFP